MRITVAAVVSTLTTGRVEDDLHPSSLPEVGSRSTSHTDLESACTCVACHPIDFAVALPVHISVYGSASAATAVLARGANSIVFLTRSALHDALAIRSSIARVELIEFESADSPIGSFSSLQASLNLVRFSTDEACTQKSCDTGLPPVDSFPSPVPSRGKLYQRRSRPTCCTSICMTTRFCSRTTRTQSRGLDSPTKA